LTIEYLSHSALEDWKQCPEKFRLIRDKKYPKRPGWALVGGSAVHLCSERYDLHELGVPVDLLTFEEAFAQILEETKQATILPESEWYVAGRKSTKYPNKEDKKWWLENGPAMYERWKAWRKVAPLDVWITPEGEPAIELGFELSIGGVPVKGYIDRIMEDRATHELLMLDIKSGSRTPRSDQVGEYAFFFHHVLPLEKPIRWGSYWMARDGSLTPPVDLSRFYDGRVEYELQRVWKAAQAGAYGPAQPSNLCGSCAVKDACYSYSEGDKVDKPY
jgi:putative RecB family exonuclease